MPKAGFGIGFGGGASGEVKGPKADIDSGSETSDGEGGRIKRKLKMPKFGIGIGGGASGKVKGSKPDDDSGSETSDGEGGRIKRKFKMPKVQMEAKSKDRHDDDSDDEHKKTKFKLPKFRFGSGKKSKGKKSKKGKDSDSDKSDDENAKMKFEIPKADLEGGIEKPAMDMHLKDRPGDSDSETSDGEGGRIKRKLKMPKVGFGIGIGGGASGEVKGSKGDDDSGSETSDGEGGRINRKLKMPKAGFGIGIGGGASGEVKGPKADIDSGSETSDGEGGRIKRKQKKSKGGFGFGLKMPKFKGFGIGFGGGASGKVKESKSDDDSGSETSDGEGGRIKRKLKTPKVGFGIGIGGGASGKMQGPKADDDSGSETSDGEGGRIKRKLKMPKVGFGFGIGGGVSGKGSKPDGDSGSFGVSPISKESVIESQSMPAKDLQADFGDIFSLSDDVPDKSVDLPSDENRNVGQFSVRGGTMSTKPVIADAELPSKEIHTAKPVSLRVLPIAKEGAILSESTPEKDLQADFGDIFSLSDDVPDKTVPVSGDVELPSIETQSRNRYSFSSEAQLRSTSTDTDDNTLDSNIKGMGSDQLKELIFKTQRQGRPSLSTGSEHVSQTTVTSSSHSSSRVVVKETFSSPTTEMEVESAPSFEKHFSGDSSSSYSIGTSLPSGRFETNTTTVNQTIRAKSNEPDKLSGTLTTETRHSVGLPKPEIRTSTDVDELESSINQMDASDIKKIIFTSSRKGRFSLPDKDEGSTKTGYQRSEGYTQRPVSMDVSHGLASSRTSGFTRPVSTGESRWRSTPDVTIVEDPAATSSESKAKYSGPSGTGSPLSLSSEHLALKTGGDSSLAGQAFEGRSLKTQSHVTTQSGSTEVRTYSRIQSKGSDSDVGFKAIKYMGAGEQRTGDIFGSTTSHTERSSMTTSSQMTTSSTSRTTMTTQSQVKKVPSLSRSIPDLLDEEIRQVKESSEKSSESVEERRRYSMEKRSEWMLSSPSDSQSTTTGTSQERKKTTLRERRRLILGQDDDASEKPKPT